MKLLYKHNLVPKNQKGFSLVELAVVVSIIGVIVAGVIGGEKLYQASKLRRLSTEIIQNTSAINTFKQEYGFYPGDFTQASSFWTGVGNGNGDGSITFVQYTTGEDTYAWEQLTSSEVMPGAYSGEVTTATSHHYTAGDNVPESNALKGITFSFFSTGTNNYIYNIHTGARLRVAALDSNGNPSGNTTGSLFANQAKAIDDKIDDGKATSGNLIGYRAGTGCTNQNYNYDLVNGTVDYQLGNNTKDCILEWFIDKL